MSEPESDLYVKAAAGCFVLARHYMKKPTLGDTSRLDVYYYYRAVCEIVCFLLHMSDRIIFDTAPASRKARMDILVQATVWAFSEEICQDPNVSNALVLLMRPSHSEPEDVDPPDWGANNKIVTRAQYHAAQREAEEAVKEELIKMEAQRRIEIGKTNDAEAVATEIFAELYDRRMEEYAGVGEDWLSKVLSKFGRNLSSALNKGELSFEIWSDAQMEGVRMQGVLTDVVPELFRP